MEDFLVACCSQSTKNHKNVEVILIQGALRGRKTWCHRGSVVKLINCKMVAIPAGLSQASVRGRPLTGQPSHDRRWPQIYWGGREAWKGPKLRCILGFSPSVLNWKCRVVFVYLAAESKTAWGLSQIRCWMIHFTETWLTFAKFVFVKSLCLCLDEYFSFRFV